MQRYGDTQHQTADFTKFIDDELLRKRRSVDVDDSPLRAAERMRRRSPSEVTVIK